MKLKALNTPSRLRPTSGQESVWDYPRPPRLEKVTEAICVIFAGETVAETTRAYRILETSHPPVYYFPPSDVRLEFLIEIPGQSFCEYKGVAKYWSLAVQGRLAVKAAWSYPVPTRSFAAIEGYLAFYASRVDECWVGSERAVAQEGDFYGGWITSRIVGPFKGAPGTFGW